MARKISLTYWGPESSVSFISIFQNGVCEKILNLKYFPFLVPSKINI